MEVNCPVCGSENCQAVKAILDQGTTTHSGSWSGYAVEGSASGAAGGVVSGSSQTTSKTNLVRRIEEFIYQGYPQNVNNLTMLILTGFALALTWGAFSMIGEFIHPNEKCNYMGQCTKEDFPLIALLIGLSFFAACGFYVFQRIKQWLAKRAHFNKNYSIWIKRKDSIVNHNFYCHKCGHIFDEEEADQLNIAAVKKMKSQGFFD
jgi:hypothetical protein